MFFAYFYMLEIFLSNLIFLLNAHIDHYFMVFVRELLQHSLILKKNLKKNFFNELFISFLKSKMIFLI